MIAPIKLGLSSVPLFLAEATSDSVKSSAIGQWLVVGAASVLIIRVFTDFWETRKSRRAHKPDSSTNTPFVTKDTHDDLKNEVEKIDRERRVSVAQLHDKIDENTRLTSNLGGQLTTMNQQLQQINAHLINSR